MKKIFFTLLSAIFIQTSFGQILNPVSFTYSTVKKGIDQYEVHIKTTVDPKWHIYSVNNPEGGALATDMVFTNALKIGKVKEVGKV